MAVAVQCIEQGACEACGTPLEYPPVRRVVEYHGHQLVDRTEYPPPWCPVCEGVEGAEVELFEVEILPF